MDEMGRPTALPFGHKPIGDGHGERPLAQGVGCIKKSTSL